MDAACEITVEAGRVDTIDDDAVRIAPVPQLYDPSTASDKRVTYASYFAETVWAIASKNL